MGGHKIMVGTEGTKGHIEDWKDGTSVRLWGEEWNGAMMDAWEKTQVR